MGEKYKRTNVKVPEDDFRLLVEEIDSIDSRIKDLQEEKKKRIRSRWISEVAFRKRRKYILSLSFNQ